METSEHRNLMAEMVRNGITARDIARLIDKDIRTAKNKISGISPFYINEGFLIQQNLFPLLSLEYLFASDNNSPIIPHTERQKQDGMEIAKTIKEDKTESEKAG